MITIFAEKPDVAKKIAAALGGIHVAGKTAPISFSELTKKDKEIHAIQAKQGYLDTVFDGKPCKVTWGYGHLCELKQAVEYNADYKNWRKLPIPFIPDPFELKMRKGKDPAKDKAHMKIIKTLFDDADYIINATDYDREGEVIFAYVYEYLKCRTPFKRAQFTSQTEKGIQEGFVKLKTPAEVEPITNAGRARRIADWLVGCNITAQTTLCFGGSGVLSVGRVQTPTLKLIVDRELAISKFVPETFWTVNAEFTTSKSEKYKGEHKTKRFKTKKEADDVMSEILHNNGIVTNIEKIRGKKEVPLLYSLSALQMDANEKHGYTLAETLSIAQSLYDGGYTTYPRSKSQYLNDDMRPVVNKVIDALETIPIYAKYITGHVRKLDDKYFDSKKVDSHFAIIPTDNVPKPGALTPKQENIYKLIALSVIRMMYPAAETEKTTVTTTVAGKHDFLSKGTTIVSPGWLEVGGSLKETVLPILANGEEVSGKYEEKEGKTEPPKYYTDKTIVAAMISAGKDLKDDELRKILADPSVEGIGTDATRANIIMRLEAQKYIERVGKTIHATNLGIELIKTLPVEDLKSAEMTAIWEKRLTAIANKKETYADFVKDIEVQTKKWCDEINTHKAPSSSVSAFAGTSYICPACGAPVKKYKWGWGCTGYKTGCQFSVSGEICKKKITETQVAKLIKDGKTDIIKGFVWKSGKTSEARLVVDKTTGKVSFEFPPKKWSKGA